MDLCENALRINLDEFENTCAIVYTKNILKTELSENDDVTINVITTGDRCVFRFLRRSVDEE